MSFLDKLKEPITVDSLKTMFSRSPKPSKDTGSEDGDQEGAKRSNHRASGIVAGGYARVDLMPKAHRDRREAREAKSLWVRIFAGAAGLTFVAVGGSFGYSVHTNQIYQDAQSREEASMQELAEYQDVTQMLRDIESLQVDVESTTETAVDWENLISTIEENLPSTSSLADYTVSPGTPSGESGTAVVVDATINSEDPLDYSEIVGFIPDSTEIRLGNMSYSGDSYSYPVSIGFSEAVLENAEDSDDDGEDTGDDETEGEG